MLLNEFLKEHRKVEEQEATITQLKSTVAQQQKNFQAAIAQQQRGGGSCYRAPQRAGGTNPEGECPA